MVDPVPGQFRRDGARSGEVSLQPGGTGTLTTVSVMQMAPDDSWWVLGAGSAGIHLTDPTWNATIVSPVTLKGSALAFEGVVRIQVREDDDSTPLGEGVVTGGMAMTPFSGSLAFTTPLPRRGAVVLSTTSAKDGTVVEASILRVRFG